MLVRLAVVVFEAVVRDADNCLFAVSLICFSVSGALAAGLAELNAVLGFGAVVVAGFGFGAAAVVDFVTPRVLVRVAVVCV